MNLTLRNPHSVLAALQSRPKDVLDIVLPSANLGSDWEKVAQLAREKKIPIKTASAKTVSPKPQKGIPSGRNLDQESGRMGIAEAHLREKPPLSLEELFRDASSRCGGKGLWIALDQLQDTHNVGAIFRTAAFFGVQGIIMTQDRSAAMTGTVYDVASGGVDAVPFAVENNLQRVFKEAKDSGLWILGTSEHSNDHYQSIPRDRPWLLVLGNEDKGMRRLTTENCDVLCGIQPKGQVTSLNVSVAAGVLVSWLSG